MLLSLVGDIIDLSKLTSGAFHFLNTKFNLATLINSTADLFWPVSEGRSIEFNVNIDYEDQLDYLEIEADEQRLR